MTSSNMTTAKGIKTRTQKQGCLGRKRNELSALRCEKCGSQKNKTVDNRPNFRDSKTRRRRECLICKHRFTTYEFVQPANMPTSDDIKKKLHFSKTKAQLDAEIADLKEALTIAVETAAELLKIGQPQARNRQSLLTWSQLAVAVDILKREVHK
jgi:LPS O-antigen subunit length determinant protein (WzzB/FepE family)